MADSKITALTALTAADPANDMIPIVDVSDTPPASGNTKRISINNILACSPSATLASATITGDLTVATSVLKVDTANTRVGINTTSINGGPFNVKISPSIDAKFVVQDGFTTGNVRLAAVDNAYSTYKIMDFSALSYAWYNSGSTAMTLDSTGLGVGTVPANGIKLASYVTTAGVPVTSGTTQSAGSLRIGAASTAGVMDMGTAGSYSWIQPCNATNLATNYDLVLNQNGGNVGIGVTSPNYKLQTTVASGANRNIFSAQITGASNGFEVLWNHATTTLRVIVSNLPTSSAGLASGTLWIDTSAGNTLKVA